MKPDVCQLKYTLVVMRSLHPRETGKDRPEVGMSTGFATVQVGPLAVYLGGLHLGKSEHT